MGFRFRLASFLIATLVVVQGVTALLVYGVTRRELVTEGARQLEVSADAFARQMHGTSERLAASVQVLSQDYALRTAVAQHEPATLLSTLRNHGRRVGATRMLLLDLDGIVRADTADAGFSGAPFQYGSLKEAALLRPAVDLVSARGRVSWMVLAPVSAPNLIGILAAEIPVDDRLLQNLRDQSALPNKVELVSDVGGRWDTVAQAGEGVSLANAFMGSSSTLPGESRVVTVANREYVTLAKPLRVARESAPVAAILGYSLDDALRPYHSVGFAWAALLAFGLAAALLGALVIARGVSRPIEALARTATRIAGGDYAPPVPVSGSGEIGALGTALADMAREIGEREERLRHQAGHDAVTSLPNRFAAEALVQRSLQSVPTVPGALLLIGLSRLPDIVKTMGHAISDRLMRDAAERMRLAGGQSLVARATDNEFAVWLPGTEKAAAISAAFRMLSALSEPYREAGIVIDAAPAAGVALFPLHGDNASTLLQRAEVALFSALGSADAVSVYDPATDPHRPERLILMADLRTAVERDELRLHYQPKLNLATGAIGGAEGLVRWQHGKRGFIPPDAFIGLAEETGNIRRLTRWALAAGVAQAQQWMEKGWELPVAVNVSARDLDDPDLPRRVADVLAAHDVPARLLVIEMTESAVMSRPDAAMQVLRKLGELGVELAIDDFGVGQSSFAYLHRLPVRELKIDRTFVKDLGANLEDQAIVRSVVELAHRLNYRVTAEGVEDVSALDYLSRVGCDYAQGYYISAALPADAFATFIAEHRARAQVGP